jgi:hypothetical protein
MPLYSPRWNAFAREAGIAGHSLSAGLTALRKANYVDKGQYNQSFFGLSIGFERLFKLILLLDFAVCNGGVYPNDAYFRDLGHDLTRLYAEVRKVHARLPDPDGRYEIPAIGVENDIIAFLSRFAKSTRYYNLDFLAGRSQPQSSMDPIVEWYADIGRQILATNYSKRARERDKHDAGVIEALMGPISMVRFSTEDGQELNTLEAASLKTGENKILQKFGTFYCTKIARFAFMILYDLEREAHGAGLDDVPALNEFFFSFMNDDRYLKSRKTFPVRG